MLLKKKYNKSTSFVSVGIISIIFTLTLIYTKYEFNNISIKEFKYDYIGNVLNYIVSFAILICSLLLKFYKKEFSNSKKIIALIIISISFLSLISTIFIDKLNLIHTSNQIFNIPIKKFINGFLLSISIFLQIFIFNYLLGLFFEVDKIYELRILSRSFISIAVLIVFTLFFVWNVNAYSLEKLSRKNYDYGFIPGAAVWSKNKPSPIFEARIRKAFELYHKKYFNKIILTGGNAPGEITEAEAAARYLINLGVNKKNIILEKETSTTSEQIKFLKNYFDNKEILVISDGFHLSRITQIAKFFNLKVEGVASDYTLSFEKAIYYRTRESIALLMFWLFAI